MLWCLTSIYGPVRPYEREDFWLELSNIRALWDVLWCLGGDFNVIRVSQHKRRGSRITRSMRGFNSFVNNCTLIDLPLMNARFIWSNFQEFPSYSRLDRFLFPMIGRLYLGFLLSVQCLG